MNDENNQLETEVHILIEALKIMFPEDFNPQDSNEWTDEQVEILEKAKEIVDECR